MKNSCERQLKVVIIGSADVIKLCVIRALGTSGCDIDVIHIGVKSKKGVKPIDYYSKYVSRYFFTSRSELVHVLLEKCKCSNTRPILFSLDDDSAFIIDNAREVLKNYFLFAHTNSVEHFTELMNKHMLKEKAVGAGMNAAKGWPIPYENGSFLIPEGIRYPCFVKGLMSYHASKGIQTRCDDESALKNILSSCKNSYPHPLYVEEFIHVDKDFGIIGICDGKNCRIFGRADLIELGKGSTNGVSMFGKVSPFDKGTALYKQIESLLSKLKYVGIFNIDFVESNDITYFVEMNFRFAAYGYGLYRAGVNLPAIFVRCIQNNNLNPMCFDATIERDYYYLNEKIGLINVLEKSVTWTKYKAMKKKADFLMVKSRKDIKPYAIFLIRVAVKFLRRLFK